MFSHIIRLLESSGSLMIYNKPLEQEEYAPSGKREDRPWLKEGPAGKMRKVAWEGAG